jgi:hypothetical protein
LPKGYNALVEEHDSVLSWLESAHAARGRARRASERAAAAESTLVAARFECEAEMDLRAAERFEAVARAVFSAGELGADIARRPINR